MTITTTRELHSMALSLVIPAALTAFVAVWWHCAATYGALLGFGLGWFPAALAALIAGYAVMIFWPVALGAFSLAVLWGAMWLWSAAFA